MICPDIESQNKLFSFLSENVIELSQQDISKIYSFWKNKFNEIDFEIPKDVKIISDRLSIRPCQNVPLNTWLLGIDFPIWFNTLEGKGKILILGIDPMRNENTFKKKRAHIERDVVIGTPYALDCARMRSGKQKEYWTLINELSKEHFVYITDVYKTFFYINRQSKRQRSYDYFDSKPIIVIDHHLGSTPSHALVFKDEQVDSNCEWIFELTKDIWSDYYDSQIADFLYMGIVTDTGNFSYDKQ